MKNKILTYSDLMPKVKKSAEVEVLFNGGDLSNEDERHRNIRLLENCRQMYDNLEGMRRNRQRILNFVFNRQFEDMMLDPDGCGYISEKQFLLRQNIQPTAVNVLMKVVKTIIGVYLGNPKEPHAYARDRDEQKLSEMMSMTMQMVYQNNDMDVLLPALLLELMVSGLYIRKQDWQFDYERQRYDVFLEAENPAMCFFNSDVSDVRFKNIRTIGFIRDAALEDILAMFAKSPQQAEQIRKWYAYVKPEFATMMRTFDKDRYENEYFYGNNTTNLCRYFEVWTKESRQMVRAHDVLKGKIVVDTPENIKKINQKRIEQITSLGGLAENAALIEGFEYFIDRYSYVRYLTPDGYTLLEMESPFIHKSDPYTLKGHIVINGELHPFMEDPIGIQKLINELNTQITLMRNASAKGVLIYPIEHDVEFTEQDKMEVLENWTRVGGVIFAKMKPGSTVASLPHQIQMNLVSNVDISLMQIYMKLVEEITGVNNAMQGNTPPSGTTASQYAMQVQAGNTNIANLLGSFDKFNRSADYKMLSLIQQYYTEKTLLSVVGNTYSNEAKWYDPEKIKDSIFDLAIVETTATPMFRMMGEQTLNDLVSKGIITPELYFELSTQPFTDRAAEIIKLEQEKQKQAAEQAQQQQIPFGNEQPQSQQAVDEQPAPQPYLTDKVHTSPEMEKIYSRLGV